MIRYQGTLEDACELIADCPHTTAKDEGEGYPLVRTPNIGFGRLVYDKMHRVSESVYNCRNRRAKPVAGDLIYAREAPAGNVALITAGENVCLGQRTVLIRPKRDVVNSVYLTYYLLDPSQRNRLLSTASGATVTHVNLPAIRGLSVSFPDLKLQNQIADILGAYDDLIENNRRRIELLEKMARELYRERFVRRAGKCSFQKKSASEWFGEITIGKTPPRKESEHFIGNMPWVSISDMGREGMFIFDTTEHLADDSVRDLRIKVVPAKTLLLSFKLTVGRLSITTVDCCTNEAIAHLRVGEKLLPYMYLYLRDYEYSKLGSTCAISDGINSKIVKSMPIEIPSNDLEVERFNEAVSPMFCQMLLLAQQNRNLVKQRDRLLPRLMSGKIDLDKLVKEGV